MQGLEAGSNHLQHRTGSGQRGQQGRLVVPFRGRLHGPRVWRVLRSYWSAGVLGLCGNVQRRVLVQPALHHRLRWQGDRAARGEPVATQPSAATADSTRNCILIPSAIAASWYRGNCVAAAASSVATHASRHDHRSASSGIATQRGLPGVAAAAAFAAAAARNCVRLASAHSTPRRCGAGIAAAAADASWSHLSSAGPSAWRCLRHISAATDHHALPRLPVPDCRLHHHIVQRDRGYRRRWYVSLQHRR
jgi:hypothetical protein